MFHTTHQRVPEVTKKAMLLSMTLERGEQHPCKPSWPCQCRRGLLYAEGVRFRDYLDNQAFRSGHQE
jgi:hypothetical protein